MSKDKSLNTAYGTEGGTVAAEPAVAVTKSETGTVVNSTVSVAKSDKGTVGSCAYIGPTILGVIQNGTIYKGTREEALAEAASAIAKHPAIEMFIVPAKEIARKQIMIHTPGNIYYVTYRKLAQGKI